MKLYPFALSPIARFNVMNDVHYFFPRVWQLRQLTLHASHVQNTKAWIPCLGRLLLECCCLGNLVGLHWHIPSGYYPPSQGESGVTTHWIFFCGTLTKNFSAGEAQALPSPWTSRILLLPAVCAVQGSSRHQQGSGPPSFLGTRSRQSPNVFVVQSAKGLMLVTPS
jgi:hypothetical protein